MWNEGNGLYPYQEQAAVTMSKANVLLAYEMGLGKTPTTIWAIEEMRERGDVDGTGTVVTPASLKWQWAAEIHKFSDQDVIVIDGSAKQRHQQYMDAREIKPGYVVLSYDTFVRDIAQHKHLGRAFLIADEATALKTWDSKRTKTFQDTHFIYPVRLALTGTPIENGKAEEIYSILKWVDPDILGPFWRFQEKYVRRNKWGGIEGYRNLDQFHKRIKPYVLRATHAQPEVAKYLPKVQHLDPYFVEMDRYTRKAVRWITGSLLDDLNNLAGRLSDPNAIFDPDHPDGKLMAKVQIMRMLLDHPDAVRLSAGKYNDPSDPTGSAFAKDIVERGLMDHVRTTPKMDALERYVIDHLDADPDHKVVIFATFIHVVDRIVQRFGDKAVPFTGVMNGYQRELSRSRFRDDPDCRVFVSTDAGGYGLDLPQANMVINFDLPWQAGMLQQRNARIKRASSQWEFVVVQDFIVKDTIEERMRQMLSHKSAVADAIVDGKGISEAGMITSDLESLRSFIQYLVEKG